MARLIALDAGTTGVRSLVVDEGGAIIDVSYREHEQHYPAPGWVEHDATEIWENILATMVDVVSRLQGHDVAAIGITNQRETIVAWDRSNGRVLAPAIVWQDKRTAERCAELRASGHLDEVRRVTGLVLDPYFSATKMAWLIEAGALEGAVEPVLGTIDSWLLWNLTGGVEGGVFATDPSNASRTLLYDMEHSSWSRSMSDLMGVPLELLPDILPSCGRFGTIDHPRLAELQGVPISGILGDQQSALFGQACFDPGMIKATYGTGAFVLMNAGESRPAAAEGLLTTVAWDLGDQGGIAYALEGSAFVAGAAIQWLRDELGIIGSAEETEALARSVESSESMKFIPAFVGLGSPWWDETARGAIVGITKGSGRGALARAVVDSLAFEVRAITDAMAEASGAALTGMRVDGGAAAMDLLLAHQAQQSRVIVERPMSLESTALGAATIAGLAEGVFSSLKDLSNLWRPNATFEPDAESDPDPAYEAWLDALSRSRAWG